MWEFTFVWKKQVSGIGPFLVSTPAWGPGDTVDYTNSFIFTKEVSLLHIITGSDEAKKDENIGEKPAAASLIPVLCGPEYKYPKEIQVVWLKSPMALGMMPLK